MWAMMVSEFADTKAMLNVVLALLKFQLQRSGVPEREIEQTILRWTDQYRAEAQQYAKSALANRTTWARERIRLKHFPSSCH
jgi:hypothetical protein